jgi:hypothetical protein
VAGDRALAYFAGQATHAKAYAARWTAEAGIVECLCSLERRLQISDPVGGILAWLAADDQLEPRVTRLVTAHEMRLDSRRCWRFSA